MIAPPIHECEEERLAVLDRYAVLDSPQEEAFDELAQLAAHLCGTPMAMVSLVDRTRQWPKSAVGLPRAATPRELSFCGHAVTGSEAVMTVPDAAQDERFAGNPFVTGPPFVRFYAGAPLTSPDGSRIGTLCVMDAVPRTLSPQQKSGLRALANQVMVQLELRSQIAERESAEAQAKRSEMLFRRLADAAPIGIYRTDDAGRCDYVNLRWGDITGQSLNDAVGSGWQKVIHPEDLPRVLATWGDAVARGSEWQALFRVLSPAGIKFAIYTAAHVSSVGWVGTVLDVTEQQRVQEQLRLSEERLQRVLKGSNDGFWDWNIVTGAVEFSPRLASMLGYDLSELVPHVSTWESLIHPDDAEPVMRELSDHIEGRSETYEAEHRLRCKDGSWLWILDRGKVVEHDAEGRPVRMAGTHTDISRRKRAEEALRRSEIRLRSIVENSLGALITTDDRGVIESVNPATEKMFGCTREALIGHSVSELIDREFASQRECLEFLRNTALNRVSELPGRRANGERFDCELSLFEFYVGDGGRHFAGHMLDVSQRQEVERLKKDFVATVSHELRTPLTSIRGSLGLLASGVMGPMTAEAKQMVAVAERNSVRLIALINDILDFEKLESGKMEMEIRPTPLMRLLERSIENISASAAQEGVAIELHCPNATIRADESRLTQVTVNLLSNAVKYSPRGGVVTVSAVAEPEGILVRIRDQGSGIAPAMQHMLFQRFQQIDSGPSRRKSGTGLGLAICKAIVEAHGGSIGVDSREGEGATFWFRIPGQPGNDGAARGVANDGQAGEDLA